MNTEGGYGAGRGGSCRLLRAQQLLIQLADALQGVFQFVVIAQPLRGMQLDALCALFRFSFVPARSRDGI